MDYQFRNEVLGAKKAAMGKMVNLAKENLKTGDRLINFASGHPSVEIFQREIIKKYMELAAESFNEDIFQYNEFGFIPLRKSLTKFLNDKGNVVKQRDELMIIHGSTEAVFLSASAFVGVGDKVVVEMPSYVNAIEAFRTLGAEIIGVPVENDGVNVEQLENILKSYRGGVKLFYTIPNFGNPSGITMAYQKRKAVYELSVKYGVLILEDDIYGNLRYRGRRIPNIKEFDTEGSVVYIGSVSKILAPAMRIGFLAADKKVIRHIAKIKEVSSNEVTRVMQYALWRMYEENDMYIWIKKICDIYAKKLFLMEESMDRYFPLSVKHSSPDGGMFIWVTLPEGTDIERYCRESAVQLHIPVTPGNGFCVTEPEKCTSLRFNFAKENMEDIEYGIRKTGKLMEQYVK